ncbi:sensor histidine kinase [Natronoglycomyces albus]|uniref:histidine kinase n=1 Tax=Natronoglycomyces albus TaxID=2811108 RepID=A0A895XS22_9ACTN|nr:HAMP domain-containing sensor histidine kinase [Natronoglycomyces albus]QSB04428.1 HAMP domain-containing protein [Natronoglycomyces albus]
MPLRVRLVAAVLALVAGSLVLISVSSIVALHTYFMHTVDSDLHKRLANFEAEEIQDAVGQGNREPHRPSEYMILYYPNPVVVFTVPGNASNRPAIDYAEVSENVGRPYTALSADGNARWRVLAEAWPPEGSLAAELAENDGEPQRYLVLAYRLEQFDSTVAGLVWINLLVAVGVLAGLAAVGVGLVRASLNPLRDIEHTAALIAAGNYSRRVPERDPATEVGRLGWAINMMLRKIERSIRNSEASEERARASEQRMREFVADASHELRTPLTTIRGYAELCRSNPELAAEQRQDYIRRIEDDAKRMGLLVEDLLLLARMDQRRPFQMRPVDLLSITTESIQAAQLVDSGHNWDVTAEGGPFMVLGDQDRLRQVVDNLLSNAVRHTPSGTSVSVKLWADDTDVVLQVSDTGPGMETDVANRVFERFYRADESRTRAGRKGSKDAERGTGLGLAIVAALVGAHGGTVQVESTQGEGTTFTVRLGFADQSGASRPTGASSPESILGAVPGTPEAPVSNAEATDRPAGSESEGDREGESHDGPPSGPDEDNDRPETSARTDDDGPTRGGGS